MGIAIFLLHIIIIIITIVTEMTFSTFDNPPKIERRPFHE